MRFRLLGPLQVVHAGVPVDVGPPKQRAVLAVLLLAGGRVVSVDRLADAVWGDEPPGSATASLQAYISNLRRALRDDAQASPIVRQPPGYFLDIDADAVDLTVFGRRCAEAAAAVERSDWDGALAAADGALELWRGPFLDDLRDQPWVAEDAARVEVLRNDCWDKRVTALLALNRVPQALTTVSELRAADPLAERGCWLHMLTLYRAGRPTDALDTYGRYARRLDTELGLQPGAELRELQTAILRQAPELSAWPRHPEWTGAGPVHTPAPAQPAQEPPDLAVPRGRLVGRTRELTVAAEVLGAVSAGATRWLVLSGPAGIGKTRLAEECAALLKESGGDVLWVSCPDESATPPWWPMRHLVRALGADADEVLEVPPDADPDIARFRVYERVQALLETAARPLAVVIDDVQWADSTSASALAYIAGSLRDRPVAVIVTVRDGEHSAEVARLLATVARGDRNRHIRVPALSSDAVAELANQVADEVVTEAEAAVLADRTGGNPFFVCEYARLPAAERAGAEIPVAVRSVLDRRFAALDPEVIAVLRTAAVIGDVLDIDGVRVLAEATGLAVDTLADHLEQAADERIVVSAHTGDGYAFAHGLLRDQLLADLPALRRRRLHADIAEVLRHSAFDGAVTRRAQHLVAAQPLVEPPEVVAACRAAAEQATAQWSSDIAAGWWQSALDAYDRLPAAARSVAERDELTVAMLEAHSRAGRGRLVLQTVEHNLVETVQAGNAVTAGRVASALLRASGGWPWLAPGHDPGPLLSLLERAAAIDAQDPAAGARVLAALAVGHCYHRDPTVAAGYLDRAQRLAEAAGDPDVLGDVLMGRLITYSGVAPRSEQTLRWVDELISLRHSRSREDAVIAHSVATMATMHLADLDATVRHLRAGIEGSEELQLPVLRAQLRWMEAVIAVWRGDFAEAERHHGIAAHVHEQTELYEAGSGLLATASLLREQGGSVPPELFAVRADPQTGGQGIVGVVRTALLTVDSTAAARDVAVRDLAAWRRRGAADSVWTTLGHQTFLAHLVADHRLDEYVAPLLDALEPFRERIAVVGQTGLAGPVALATARLHAVRGDRGRALADVAVARGIASRTGGLPSLVRCRLLECELAEPGPARSATAHEVAAEATRLGMRAVAAAAERLV